MSRAESTSADRMVWIIEGRDAECYHHNPGCTFMNQGWRDRRMVPSSAADHRKPCAHCVTGKENGPNWKNGQCRSCGLHVGDRPCAFCDVFDDIHSVPSEARFCRLEDREVLTA